MTNFSFDLRHALRALVKSPSLFLSAALLLALGIGATAVFRVVNRVVLPGYFDAMGTELLAGRYLDRDDEERVDPMRVLREE